ncbi:MAG: hypothetical protein ACPGPE_10220 [Planctomycetota bacterium]
MTEVALSELWAPILVSATAVFQARAVIHMATGWHRSDYRPFPDEAGVLSVMREAGVEPGGYAFPYASSMKEMGDEGFIARQRLGPVGFVQVLPSGPIRMGTNLLCWFLYSALIATFTAYLATLCLERGADYLDVFRVTGTVAVLGFGTAPIQDSIWKAVRWPVTARFVLDGALYGILTAGVFGAMWPDA